MEILITDPSGGVTTGISIFSNNYESPEAACDVCMFGEQSATFPRAFPFFRN